MRTFWALLVTILIVSSTAMTSAFYSAHSLAQDNALSNNLANLFSDEPTFLKVDDAFIINFEQQDRVLSVTFDIADGYYLYDKQFKTVTKQATLSEPTKSPEPRQIEDEFFGVSNVYFDRVTLTYDIAQSNENGLVRLRYQGCAEAGLCYPPTVKEIFLSRVIADNSATSDAPAASTKQAPISEQYRLADQLFSSDNLLLTLLLFVGLGTLLAFTPCVFPMYPILSSIIVGQGTQLSTARAFTLAFVYVQGMAITYSLLGLVVASAGVQFQAALQHPVLLSVFVALFVLFALSMFGLFEIQLPSSWQERLNAMSNKQRGGTFAGVFLMGVISGLIASPCTTAPLTSILLFIAQSGDMLLGFSALYALSIGMGIPLIIFAMTGGKLLPKAGAWMNVIKVIFGFMILSVAILFLERMIVAEWTILLWSLLGLMAATYLWGVNEGRPSRFQLVSRAILFIGVFVSLMPAYQYVYPSAHGPVAGVTNDSTLNSKGHPEFTLVRDLGDLAMQIERANAQGKSVMVDWYADWCVACKEFEKYTFPDPAVINALGNTVWLQIDLTSNTPENANFYDTFDVTGLPTIMFFDTQGNELTTSRVTGFMDAETFANHVNQLFN